MEAEHDAMDLPRLEYAEMDADHEALLGQAHALTEGLRGDLPTFVVLERLDDLLSLALQHFDREEQQMSDAGFPHLDEHVRSHDRLMRAMLHFRDDVRFQRYRTELAVRFIEAWVVNHIRIDDARFAAFLRAGERGEAVGR